MVESTADDGGSKYGHGSPEISDATPPVNHVAMSANQTCSMLLGEPLVGLDECCCYRVRDAYATPCPKF